jgi:predicted metal-dependent hydrolase
VRDPSQENKEPDLFSQGIKEFNGRQFFACHETLETFWRTQPMPEREFTQGIIQSAVAFYHLKRNNFTGAIKLLKRALPRLQKFAPVCMGLEVLTLTDSLTTILQLLEQGEITEYAKLPEPPQIKAKKK